MAESAEERLAGQLLAGVAHLQAGELTKAIHALSEVVDSPELARAEDLVDVRARALSLLGDALLRSGRHDEAAGHVKEALDLVRGLGDPAGIAALQPLLQRVLDAQKAADQARLRARSAANLHRMDVEELRGRFRGLQLADVLVKKANAAIDHGESESAAELAREALALASELDGVREEVLARLSLVRADVSNAEQELLAAWRRAERAGEFNLVAAVARAGEVHGIPLPKQVGPGLPGEVPFAVGSDGDHNEPMG